MFQLLERDRVLLEHVLEGSANHLGHCGVLTCVDNRR
jgi:hypothetical protein